MPTARSYLACALILALFAPAVADAAAPQSKADTQAAFKAVENWLGPGANGAGWRTYLKLEALDQELKRSGPPDAKVLADVLKRLESGAVGLDQQQFVTLRAALTTWLNQEAVPTPADLQEAIKQASGEFKPVTPEAVAKAREQLTAVAKQLDGYLLSLGSVGPGWRTYLQFNDLKTQLQPATEPDVKLLETISTRFAADKPGLELAPIRNTGLALAKYVELLQLSGEAELDKQFTTKLEELTKSLAAYLADPNEKSAAETDQALSWLKQVQQAPALIRDVRRYFGRPNLFVNVKEKIVGAGIAQPVENTMAISDNIMGTQISGTGRTVGRLYLELVPDAKHATFDAMLTGTIYSNTVGRNGPATISSQGATQISGRKRISVDANGIRSLPATAAAITNNRITGVQAGGRIAQSIAQKRVGESQGQAQQVAQQHAEAKLRDRLDSEVGARLAKANRDFQEKFRNPLVRRDQFPAIFDLSTDREQLHLTALEAGGVQLGAPSSPPSLDASAFDMSVQLHESAANNVLATALSGVTLENEQVKAEIKRMGGTLPKDLDDPDQPAWSVSFRKLRPVSVSIGSGAFDVTMRVSGYSSGTRTFRGAMDIRAVYKIEPTADGGWLARRGDLQIDPPNFDPEKSRRSIEQQAFRTVLQKKFAKLFKETYGNEPLVLPGQWKKAGELGLAHLAADKGWAVVGWKVLKAPAATPPVASSATNAP